jgi:hypothetical protein
LSADHLLDIMGARHTFILLLALLSVVGCNRAPHSTAALGLEQEKQRWTSQGWSFTETFGSGSADGAYVSHMSSPTARSVTAFASASGTRTSKVYQQTNALYLVVSMLRPSGDTFALVFTKPK